MTGARIHRSRPSRRALAALALALLFALGLPSPALAGEPQVERSAGYEIAFNSDPPVPFVNQAARLQFAAIDAAAGRPAAIAGVNVSIEDPDGKSITRQVAGDRFRHTFQTSGPHILRVLLQLADGTAVRATFFVNTAVPDRVTLGILARSLQGVFPATVLTWLHVAAATVWGGATVFLVAVLHPAALGQPDGPRVLEAAYRRFNPLIAPSLVVLVATGFMRAGYHGFTAGKGFTLFLTTAYGFALLLKLLAFLAMLGLGLYVALALVPRLREGANPDAGAVAARLSRRIALLTGLELFLGGVAFLLGTLFLQIHFIF